MGVLYVRVGRVPPRRTYSTGTSLCLPVKAFREPPSRSRYYKLFPVCCGVARARSPEVWVSGGPR
eukprot:4914311-Pyramimonas_sp.AAC.1